jgi:hypothetical protein
MSGFIRQVASEPPDLLTQPPHLKNALGVRNLHPIRKVASIRVGGRLVAPDSYGSARVPAVVVTHLVIIAR